MLNPGIYVAEHNNSMFDEYRIKISVKETEKSYIFQLIKFESRYSADHMKLVFNGKDKAVIKKDRSQHTMRVWGDNCFTIYPFRAGIPFYFKKES